ncbi:assimilatory sulfite reductase (NADPH) flavoprotein subunit [Labilibacter sediminis]|nr:assimilatory sulfite reductase (NADPH) flavoprotein subunit [Labilibacter sediminis]
MSSTAIVISFFIEVMIQAFTNVFSVEQIKQAQELYTSLSAEQRLWLSGYLSGLNQSGALLDGVAVNGNGASVLGGNGSEVVGVVEEVQLTILYGTHTGNSKLLAQKASDLAQSNGAKVSMVSMDEYKSRKLKEEQNLLVIVSTHGEGDPPASAEDFYSYIFGKKAPKSGSLNYAVIGLGDSSYAKFCQTGRDIYDQLKKLGANNVHDFVELDVDFKDNIGTVLPSVVSNFTKSVVQPQVQEVVKDLGAIDSDQWVEVEVLDKVLLNGRGSKKETYHIELDIEDAGLVYKPGDALEVVSFNSPSLVREILKNLDINEDEQVEIAGVTKTIEQALITDYELTVVTNPVIKKYAEIAKNKDLDALIADNEKLQEYIYGADFLDLITHYPAQLDAASLIGFLRKLPARLYSISSSYEYNPDEVHITVGAVRYELNDRKHHGVCSGFLADQINPGETVNVRIKNNDGFRLPEDKQAKVIMVGPGTGIAPFRSFLQEREVTEAEGGNWLFFGDQHFETDFLYQTELLQFRSEGLLTQLDVAFSRDQKEKVYVQDRMKEHGAQVYDWLKQGAYFYLCGDMNKMAKDVKKELVNIIEAHGKMTKKDAAAYLKEVRAEGRFQEDVY